MKSLFGRKKKDVSVDNDAVEELKDDLEHIEEHSGELFDDVETEKNGLFDDMETLNNNNNNDLIGRMKPNSEDDEDYEDEEDDDDDDVATHPIEGMYDPAEFVDLSVSSEVREVFEYITRYVPQKIELDYKLKPFIPDFIPAVGDIDAFIKVEADNKLELGLTVLDEPSAKQSDPNIIELQLRSVSKTSNSRMSKIKKVRDVDKEVKIVEKWIKDIEDLHRSKPAPTIQYSKQMPDIDHLMQEWPHEVEMMTGKSNMSLPSAELDTSLESYVDILCSVLDIPVYKSRVQALHVMFTLFSAFKQSEHFGYQFNTEDKQDA